MNNLSKPVLEAEWHQLELSYQYLRKHTQSEQQRLMLSIHTYGLLEPVMVTVLRFDLIDTFRPVLIDRGTKCLVSKKNAEFLPRHYL